MSRPESAEVVVENDGYQKSRQDEQDPLEGDSIDTALGRGYNLVLHDLVVAQDEHCPWRVYGYHRIHLAVRADAVIEPAYGYGVEERDEEEYSRRQPEEGIEHAYEREKKGGRPDCHLGAEIADF